MMQIDSICEVKTNISTKEAEMKAESLCKKVYKSDGTNTELNHALSSTLSSQRCFFAYLGCSKVTSALSPLSCSFSFFLARSIAVVSTYRLVCNSSIVATCPSIPAACFAFRLLSPSTTKLWRGYRVCPVRMYVSTYVRTFVRMFTRSSDLIYYPISI